MSSVITTELERSRKDDPGTRLADVAAAVGWGILAGVRLVSLVLRPSLLQAGLVLFCVLIAVLFVIRRAAGAKGSWASCWLAYAATFLPGLALRPSEAGLRLAGEAVQSCGLALMIAAAVTLRRSFGIAPAHRGLVTRGAYGVVRHPLYGGEIVAIAGYCIGYASPWNLLVGMATVLAQLLRIRAEERLLSRDAAYEAYRARVRWRLAPGIW